MKTILILVICSLGLIGCSAKQTSYSGQKSIDKILDSSFKPQRFQTSTFILYGLLRPTKNNSSSLHVYIEGDGFSWITRTRRSNNPTPTDDVTSKLAANDHTNAAVLYLARPCQYLQEHELPFCQPKYWDNHRLAPEVITGLNEAISQAKSATNAQSVSIIGFSGGGGAAVLVAARRDDVVFLGSVAGLLDHEKWVKTHGISPLHGSLNPLNYAHKVNHIPQLHITSDDDDIVPTHVNKNFCAKLRQANACINIPELEHMSPWYKYWDYSMELQ